MLPIRNGLTALKQTENKYGLTRDVLLTYIQISMLTEMIFYYLENEAYPPNQNAGRKNTFSGHITHKAALQQIRSVYQSQYCLLPHSSGSMVQGFHVT